VKRHQLLLLLLLLLRMLLLQDVEGYEPSVIRTAQTLLSTGAVDNVVLEYSPGVYERSSRCASKECRI
jgi:hypothetical protein